MVISHGWNCSLPSAFYCWWSFCSTGSHLLSLLQSVTLCLFAGCHSLYAPCCPALLHFSGYCYCCSVARSCPDSLWPPGLQHTRLPCPSPPPRACSNSCPLSQWCHPTISPSVVPFSSCLPSFPASGSFFSSWSWRELVLHIGGQSIGASASASVFPMNIQGWFPSGFTSLISLILEYYTWRLKLFCLFLLFMYYFSEKYYKPIILQWLPHGSDSKQFACNAGDLGLIPGSGRSPGEGNGNTFQNPCLENPMDRGPWWVTVHGITNSWTRLSD